MVAIAHPLIRPKHTLDCGVLALRAVCLESVFTTDTGDRTRTFVFIILQSIANNGDNGFVCTPMRARIGMPGSELHPDIPQVIEAVEHKESFRP